MIFNIQKLNLLLKSSPTQISESLFKTFIREKSKKTGTSTQNHGNARWKHKGIRAPAGKFVQKGTTLVIQNNLRFHPGLNVGIGRNFTLVALRPGIVRVSSEKPELDMEHSFNKLFYGGRVIENMYKKYFNIIPKPQHNRFKLVDKI